MKINLNKNVIVLILIFVISLAMRLYQLSFFEYKGDQYAAIGLGNDTRAAHFLITHGYSGVGLTAPPVYPYAMGILTTFTNDPARLTFYFFCINILALALAIIYFYRTLPAQYAILSAAFLGLFPAFTIYTSNIWPFLFYPLIMILFNISLYRLVKYDLWRNFFYMGVLAVFAAQLDLSGFFILPLLVVIAIAYWKKIDKKVILWTLLTAFILFIPFLINLFIEKELVNFITYGASGERNFPWRIFLWHSRMASFDFFRYYFSGDFNATLIRIAGDWRFVLYPLTFIPGLFFIFGFISYIGWLIKERRVFDRSEGVFNEHPLPFQISGLMVLVVTLGHMILRIPLQMHYFIVLFPAYSVLTGFAAFKIGKFYWGKLLVLLGILSTVILLVGTLVFLDRAGGHPDEYGVSYKTLVSWQKELRAMKRKGECFNLTVNFIGDGKSDVEPVLAVLNENNQCKPGDKIIPEQINISWNDKLMRYEHSY